VDVTTGEVFGHVVASDDFGEAYVIPLRDIFQDMRRQIPAFLVHIPTSTDIRDWQKQQIENTVTPHQSDSISILKEETSADSESSQQKGPLPEVSHNLPTFFNPFLESTSPPAPFTPHPSHSIWNQVPTIPPQYHWSTAYGPIANSSSFQPPWPTDSGYSSMKTSPGPSLETSPKYLSSTWKRLQNLQLQTSSSDMETSPKSSTPNTPQSPDMLFKPRNKGWTSNVAEHIKEVLRKTVFVWMKKAED
jgi:hypothetical protein